MYLTRHQTAQGPRWARDGYFSPFSLSLGFLLELRRSAMLGLLATLPQEEPATGTLLAPLEPLHEVWGAGVTYLRSRDARKAESATGDIYEKVYAATRPELFFKAIGWRVAGHKMPVRIRQDSHWNVPEPELTLVVNRHLEIVAYCAGNDMSSRDIEGENPLYLPQAKIYDGSCALGPGLLLAEPDELSDLPIELEVLREGSISFQGATRTSNMKRRLQDLATYLGLELALPHGAFLMTGTGIVPGSDFSLQPGDTVRIKIGSLVLENEVRGEDVGFGQQHTAGDRRPPTRAPRS
jgi:2-dehydro-3-deoxy-D-arabinonate dehydratase